MWDWFVQFLISVLEQLATMTGDWGMAVIILTVIVRVLLTPLVTKSSASTAKMQVLQPKMMEIQERYADDPERQMAEMRKFQAENNFNPLGGCLPTLLQMPIFFALFAAMKSVPTDACFYNIMPSIALSVREAITEFGLMGAWIYIIFDVGFGAMTLAQMVVNLKNVPPEQQQQNLIMGMMMGLMMIWFGFSVPAAVLLYYVTSTLWQVVQQQLITKRVTAKVKAETEAKVADMPKTISVERRERKPRPKKKG